LVNFKHFTRNGDSGGGGCRGALLGKGLAIRRVSVAHCNISALLLVSSGAPKNGAPLVPI
jgi:hypothetical protein